MKSFLEFYSQIKEDAMDAANPAMQAPQAPTMQNVRPAPAMAKRLQPQPPAGQQQQAGQAPAGQVPKGQVPKGQEKDMADKLQAMLGKSYEEFVTLLGTTITTDDKFFEFLNAGLQDGKPAEDDVVEFAAITPKCSALHPTQNEIDLSNSLGYPLIKESKETLTSYFNGGTFSPGGKPIITCGGGQFIIDGHHRWSQLYCMNPDAQINAIDLTQYSDATQALKIVQLAIAAKLKKVPVQVVSGTNLIGISENTLRKYISDNFSKNANEAFSLLQKSTNSKQEGNFEFILNYLKRLDEFEKDGTLYPDYDDGRGGSGVANEKPQKNKPSDNRMGNEKELDPYKYATEQDSNPIIEFAREHIWKNVQQMNATNKPMPGASKRDFMPQTDDATGWKDDLEDGKINISQECLVLSGLIIRD